MKKLLVLALTVIMLLSMVAVSMAATVIAGELNFGWTLTEGAQADFGNAKLKFTTALTDTVTSFVALKGTVADAAKVDEAWASFKADTLTTKVGYFGTNIKDNMDILKSVDDLKTQANIQVSGKVSDSVTLVGTLGRDYVGTEWQNGYVLAAKYDTDAFGGSVAYYLAPIKDVKAVIALNAYYLLTPAKVYFHYATSDGTNVAFVGGLYDSDSIYGRVETQVAGPDGYKAKTGYRLGYKFAKGPTSIEYNGTTQDSTSTSEIKLKMVF